MKTPEEKRWERLQQLLIAEANGDAPIKISSTKTLFGIKSHVETVIDKVVEEENCRTGALREGTIGEGERDGATSARESAVRASDGAVSASESAAEIDSQCEDEDGDEDNH